MSFQNLLIKRALTWSLVVLAIGCACFWIWKSGFKIEIIAFIGILVQICGVIVLMYQIQKMARNTKSLHEWEKEIKTLETISNYREEISAGLQFTNTQYADKGGKIPINLKTGEMAYRHVTTVLNNFERIAAGIKHDAFDDDIAYRLLRGMLVASYDNSKDFIKQHRTDKANPRAWKEIEKLATKWNDRYDDETKMRDKDKPKVD